jgi:hypothetical protein
MRRRMVNAASSLLWEMQRCGRAFSLPGVQIVENFRGGLVAQLDIRLHAFADDVAENLRNRAVVTGTRC